MNLIKIEIAPCDIAEDLCDGELFAELLNWISHALNAEEKSISEFALHTEIYKSDENTAIIEALAKAFGLIKERKSK